MSTLEFDGVELAAIQALKKDADAKDAKMEALEKQNAEQTKLLLELRARLDAIAPQH